MLFFENDYGYGAHPKVLEHLMETNMEAVSGYGNDKFTASAAEKIKKACSCPEGQVYFLTGGTQTNMVVIDTLLRPYEGVVASSCGHVNTHEAGAIESTGHKVLTVPHKNGKLDADDLRDYVQTFYADASHDHMVFPGMVYISHPSEYGTVYTKNELERISAVCHEFDMPLFLDGARLGYGLASDTDVTLADIARLALRHAGGNLTREIRRDDTVGGKLLRKAVARLSVIERGEGTGKQLILRLCDEGGDKAGENIAGARLCKRGRACRIYIYGIPVCCQGARAFQH